MLPDTPIRRYERLSTRILEILDQSGGLIEGTFDLAITCGAPASRIQREIRRLERQRIIRIQHGGGRGRKTRITRL